MKFELIDFLPGIIIKIVVPAITELGVEGETTHQVRVQQSMESIYGIHILLEVPLTIKGLLVWKVPAISIENNRKIIALLQHNFEGEVLDAPVEATSLTIMGKL
ncbi:MAG: hypothetical protein WBB28_02085 [Crinalium sp.]